MSSSPTWPIRSPFSKTSSPFPPLPSLLLPPPSPLPGVTGQPDYLPRYPSHSWASPSPLTPNPFPHQVLLPPELSKLSTHSSPPAPPVQAIPIWTQQQAPDTFSWADPPTPVRSDLQIAADGDTGNPPASRESAEAQHLAFLDSLALGYSY